MPIPHPTIEEPQMPEYNSEQIVRGLPDPTPEQRELWFEMEENYDPQNYNSEIDFMALPAYVTAHLASEVTLIKLKKIRDKHGLSAEQLKKLSRFLKRLVLDLVPEGIRDLKKLIAEDLAISEGLAEEIAFDLEGEIFPPIMARLRELYGYKELTEGIIPSPAEPEKKPEVAQPADEAGKKESESLMSRLAQYKEREISKNPPPETAAPVKQETAPQTPPQTVPGDALKPAPETVPLPETKTAPGPKSEDMPKSQEQPTEPKTKKVILEGNVVDLRDLIS